MIKHHAKDFLLNIAKQTDLLRLAQYPRHEAGDYLFVLAYHRVADTDSPLSNRLYDLVRSTPRQFDEQMRLISTCFTPVSAEDVLNALHGDKPLPAQAVLVTVDDGYRDFKETIFPITHMRPIQLDTLLRRFSLQSKEAKQFAYDALTNYVHMQPFEITLSEIDQICGEITSNDNQRISYTLNWDELRALSKVGVTIAPHTHNHPILTHIPIEKAHDKIRISLGLIKQQIGQCLPLFAYSDGRDYAMNNDLALML